MPGPTTPTNVKRILALFASGLMQIAFGADNAANNSVEIELPDLELLEFLGQFETDTGEWIDPGSLLADEFEDLLDVAEGTNPAPENADDNADH